MQRKSDIMLNKGNSSSRVHGNFRGRGRGYDIRHCQFRFCKTEINRRSVEIKSVC